MRRRKTEARVSRNVRSGLGFEYVLGNSLGNIEWSAAAQHFEGQLAALRQVVCEVGFDNGCQFPIEDGEVDFVVERKER